MKYAAFVSETRRLFSSEKFIPLHEPFFDKTEKDYLTDTIDSTFVSSVGAYVDRAEKSFAELVSSTRAVAVVNGTSALQVGLRLAGVGRGDEVITQALTFVATANAIHYNHATPVFVDVDLDTMGLSPEALENFLQLHAEIRENGCFNKNTGRRISACVPMHTFGFMCRIKEVCEICEKWGIPVVEDSAEALGSTYFGQSAGTFGLLGCFSFNGNKIITSGGGGMIVTDNVAIGDRAKFLTTTAKEPHAWEYIHNEVGYNFRMPNLNAALLCAQMEKFNQFIASKKVLFKEYCKLSEEIGFTVKSIPEGTGWNYWLMSLQFESRIERDAFLEETNRAGVMTRPIWRLMHKLPMYDSCQRDSQVNAEFLEDRIVNIPSSYRPISVNK